MSLLPNTIEMTPKVLVGDGVSTGQITPDDWVKVDSVVFNSAAKFQIKADDRIEVVQSSANSKTRRRARASATI